MKPHEKVISAWNNGQPAVCGNGMTDGTSIFLHGHKIVERTSPTTVSVSFAGWPTTTTASWINDALRGFGPGGSDYRVCVDHGRTCLRNVVHGELTVIAPAVMVAVPRSVR